MRVGKVSMRANCENILFKRCCVTNGVIRKSNILRRIPKKPYLYRGSAKVRKAHAEARKGSPYKAVRLAADFA